MLFDTCKLFAMNLLLNHNVFEWRQVSAAHHTRRVRTQRTEPRVYDLSHSGRGNPYQLSVVFHVRGVLKFSLPMVNPLVVS